MHLTALLWAHAAALQQPFRAASRRAVAARARFETGDDVPGGTYETYEHDGWTCGYRHKTGCEPAIVLLHPVGIGLSSWFWTRVMAELPNEVYAPDFIGCGRSDAWDPAERGLFLPLDYSRQVEELWRQKIGKPCCVVAQGGLAPVGVYLASRSSDRWDGARAVAGLALSAPPPFADLAEGLDSAEVARNLEFLQSSLGRQLVKLLRSSFFVRFFSNLFLFADSCDEAWIGNCQCINQIFAARRPLRPPDSLIHLRTGNCLIDDERPKSIEPVLTFNAGVVGARGLFDELKTQVPQPVLVIEGSADKRSEKRSGYAETVPDLERVAIEGSCNVPPWERPGLVADAIGALVLRARRLGRLEAPG